MNIKKWLNKNTNNLTGKTVVITGSTGGIGECLTWILASLNANLIFCNRNKQKSEELSSKILKKYPNIKIENLTVNLEELNSTEKLFNELKNKTFDYLIHNAAVYNVPMHKTESGVNNVFQINFLSPYVITKNLIHTLKQNKAKVIVVGSIAHNYSKIDPSNIDFSNKKPSKVYGNSKRFLMFALMKLLEKEHIPFSIAHPGITLTQITNHYPKAINWLVKIMIKLLFPSPQNASLSIIKALFEQTQSNEWIGPRACNIWGKPKISKLVSASEKEQQLIFEISENITNKK